MQAGCGAAGGCGVAHDEGWEKGKGAAGSPVGDAFDQFASGSLSDGVEGLLNGGEGGKCDAGLDDIVETEDGEILWNAPAGGAKSVDGADGGHVVEGHQRGELTAMGDELIGAPGTFFDGGERHQVKALELDDEVGINGDGEFLGGGENGIPAVFTVDAALMTADKGEFAVSEFDKMSHAEQDAHVVMDDEGGSAGLVMGTADVDGGEREPGGVGGVDHENALDATIDKELGGLLSAHGGPVVAGSEELVFGVHEELLDATEEACGVALGEVRGDDPDQEAAAGIEGSAEEAGFVVELGGSVENAFAG